MPRLSVIVTSYNIEQYLEESLDSVVNQTLEDIEIIVVDDGSSDSSPDIIRAYAEKDSRVVPVILGENSIGGVATAANAGLDRATGDYIGFADGDDLYELDMFEKLVLAAEENNSDLAMCNYREFSGDLGDLGVPADEHRWLELSDSAYHLDDEMRKVILRFIAVPWRKIYRRTLIEENHIRFPVGDYFFEDNPFHWFSVVQANSIALVPEVLCYHRVARAGQTMSTADERLFKIFQHHETIYKFLQEKNLLDEYSIVLLTWVISQMEWISRKTEAPLYRKLYEALRPVFAHYTENDVRRALAEGGKGQYGSQLSLAIAKGQYPRVVNILEGSAATSRRRGLVQRGVNHLRYSGPRKTAEITAKYVSQRAEATGKNLKKRAMQGGVHSNASNDQVLFALAILESRLDQIEAKLDALENSGK